MNVLINRSLLKDNKTVNMDAIVYDKLSECDFNCDDFIFGTIQECSKLKDMPNCSFMDIKVSDWLAFLKEEYINYNGYFKQAWQLNETDIGKFCRCNSGNKSWAGQLISTKIDIDTISQLVMEDEVLYIAPSQNIINEKRFWVIDGKIIGSSHYYNPFNTNIDCEYNNDEALNYAKKIIDIYYEPATQYTLDIGWDTNKGKFQVIEYNCFNTSGFYKSDVNQIIKKVKEKFDAASDKVVRQ